VQLGSHRVEQALDDGDLVGGSDVLHLDRARVEGAAIDVGRAGLADVDAASVLRAGDPEQVAENPQEPHVGIDVDRDRLAVVSSRQ
jgi:hypothetical protein